MRSSARSPALSPPELAATKNLPAVKNKCYLPLAYDEVTPGPRDAAAVVAIAHVLHPAAFGLPPDGS